MLEGQLAQKLRAQRRSLSQAQKYRFIGGMQMTLCPELFFSVPDKRILSSLAVESGRNQEYFGLSYC